MGKATWTTLALLAAVLTVGFLGGCGSSKSKELERANSGPLTMDEQPRFEEERADSGAH